MPKIPKIAIPAPASALSEAVAKKAVSGLKAHINADIVMGEDCWNRGNAADRAKVFLAYALDDSIDVILAYRGGEGSADIIPFLDEHRDALKAAKPKVISGMSDITALLFYFYQVIGWPVVHGLVATHFVKQLLPEVVEDFKLAVKVGLLQSSMNLDPRLSGDDSKKSGSILLGDSLKEAEDLVSCHSRLAKNPASCHSREGGNPVIKGLKPLNSLAQNTPELIGPAIGGNLTLLQLSIKDIWEFNASGKILFLEDWHEKGYRVWRALKYLNRIGKFEGVKAIVFGDFCCATIMSDPAEDKTQKAYLMKCLSGFSKDCDFPVYQTDWFGHGDQNQSVPFGEVLLKLT